MFNMKSLFLLCLLEVFLNGILGEKYECEQFKYVPSKKIGNSVYVLYQNNLDSFGDSKQFCEERGGQLAEPTQKEWKDVVEFVSKLDRGNQDFWINAYRENLKDNFKYAKSGVDLKNPESSPAFPPLFNGLYEPYYDRPEATRRNQTHRVVGSVSGWRVLSSPIFPQSPVRGGKGRPSYYYGGETATPVCEYPSGKEVKGEAVFSYKTSGKQYAIHAKRQVSYDDAKEICKENGGELFAPKTAKLFKELRENFLNPAFNVLSSGFTGVYISQYWLPLIYDPNTQSAKWEDRSGNEVKLRSYETFPPWHSDSPCLGRHAYVSAPEFTFRVADRPQRGGMNALCSFPSCDVIVKKGDKGCKYKAPEDTNEFKVGSKRYILFRRYVSFNRAVAMCDEIGGKLATPNKGEWENLSDQFCPNRTRNSFGTDYWLGYQKTKDAIANFYDPKETLPISKPAFPPYGNDNDEQRLKFLAPNAAVLASDYAGWNVASLSTTATPVCESEGTITKRTTTQQPITEPNNTYDDYFPTEPPYYDYHTPEPYDPNRERGRVSANGKTYFVYEGHMNYSDASDLCKEKGQKLPTFKSTEEYVAFRKALQIRNISPPPRPYYNKHDHLDYRYQSSLYVSNFWIGIRYKDNGLKGEYDNKPIPGPNQRLEFPPISSDLQNLGIPIPISRRPKDVITYPVKAVNNAWVIQRTINEGSSSSGFMCEFDKC